MVGVRFVEKLRAGFGAQFPYGWRMGLLRGVHAGVMKVKDRVRIMHPASIGTSVGFILFDPHRSSHQNDFPTIRTASDADVSLLIIRPTLEAVP